MGVVGKVKKVAAAAENEAKPPRKQRKVGRKEGGEVFSSFSSRRSHDAGRGF